MSTVFVHGTVSLKLRVTTDSGTLGEIDLECTPFRSTERGVANVEPMQIRAAYHVADASTCKGWLIDGGSVRPIELTLPHEVLGEGDTISIASGMLNISGV